MRSYIQQEEFNKWHLMIPKRQFWNDPTGGPEGNLVEAHHPELYIAQPHKGTIPVMSSSPPPPPHLPPEVLRRIAKFPAVKFGVYYFVSPDFFEGVFTLMADETQQFWWEGAGWLRECQAFFHLKPIPPGYGDHSDPENPPGLCSHLR